MTIDERMRVEDALRRIDELVAALGHVADPVARETARGLVETILDVHGIALARIMAMLAAAEGGNELTGRLAQDEQVKALLLLYGLHPDDPETRVRQALAAMRPRLTAAGIAVELGPVTSSAASLRVTGDADRISPALRQEIEEAVIDAAPDLDEIAIEWPDPDPGETGRRGGADLPKADPRC